MHLIWALLAVALLAAACGDENGQGVTLTLPADTPPETIKLIQDTAPALEKHLPGLLKYQGSMTFQSVEPHSPYSPAPGSGLPEDTPVTWLEFVVADDGGTIPKAYRAWGHHISIGIVESGEALILKKDQAKSVFLDRVIPASGADLVILIHQRGSLLAEPQIKAEKKTGQAVRRTAIQWRGD